MSARRITAALGTAALGVTVWATVIERRLFTVRRHTLPVLPVGASPVRVLHLSDLHLAPWQRGKSEWVRSLAELQPDLVVLTGDLIGVGPSQGRGNSMYGIEAVLRSLAPLAGSGAETVFVHGSNDYYGPVLKNPFTYFSGPTRRRTRTPDIDNEALTAGLEGIGAINLNNSAARIPLRGTEVELLGMNDPHIRLDDAAAMRDALTALAAENPDPASVRLGVVHAPYQEALGEFLDDRVDLIFAGHTHGGQVRLPGKGALVSNCDLPLEQTRGMSVWFDAHHAAFLNVSAGLGNSIYAPVRFACRPEASLITLESARG